MLPKSARADLIRYQWVHAGLPWLDPLNEIQANIAAISAGLDTRTNILAQQGRDVADVARELAEETALFARYGLPTDVRPIHALIPRVAVGDDQAKGAAA
jgi:capsid protein